MQFKKGSKLQRQTMAEWRKTLIQTGIDQDQMAMFKEMWKKKDYWPECNFMKEKPGTSGINKLSCQPSCLSDKAEALTDQLWFPLN